MSVSGQGARALLVAMALACPAGAAAQLSTVGGPFAAAIGGSAYARTADVGHDTAHNVFLLATSEHQTGRVFGSFSNGDGALVQGGFRIDSTANFAFGPAIAYSAQADAFLVLWVNDAAQVRGRLVRYGTGALGSADFLVATGARKTWAPAIAYSPTSQEFLVSWSSSAGPNWILRVSTSGAPIGSPIQVTGNVWTQEPALAWNPANNEFMLAYAQEINPGWQVRVQRVSQGQPVGGPATIHAAGSTKMPDIAFSTQSGKFLVCWFQGSPYGIYSRLINQDGSAAAAVQPLLPSSYGSYDANSLSYNDFTDTFAVASITSQNSLDTIGGAEVSSLGVPGAAARWVDAPAGTGNRRYPEIAAGNANGRFVTIFNKSQNSFYGQALNSGATGGGGGGTPLPLPPGPLTVTSLTANVAFPVTAGAAVTFTATTSGGTAPIQYKFWAHNSTSGWSMIRDYATSSQTTYTPPVGTNRLQVWVRSSGSSADYEAWAPSASFDVIGAVPVMTGIARTPSSGALNAGSSISWTAQYAGGDNPQFKFWLYDRQTAKWFMARDYASSPTYTWIPSAEQAGEWALQVWVRNGNSSASYQSWLSTDWFRIESATPAISAVLRSTGPIVTPGTPIQFTALGRGGTGPLVYRFMLYDGSQGDWSQICAYSSSNNCTWVPDANDLGPYVVQAWVKHQGSSAQYEGFKSSDEFVVTPITATSLVLSPADSGYNAGQTITIVGSASGGSGAYEYQFWRYKVETAEWSLAQPWSTNNTHAWTPTTAPGSLGTFVFQMWVRTANSGSQFERWQNTGQFTVTP